MTRYLPLAHVVNDDVFITHGGLPRDRSVGLKEIAAVDRVKATTESYGKAMQIHPYFSIREPFREPIRVRQASTTRGGQLGCERMMEILATK